ncbi:MAG: methyltransferase domain-containing protein [Spirochaetota bacterium]|nr:methyltransferase domain-containing protein [Spirochaetota bacterium]
MNNFGIREFKKSWLNKEKITHSFSKSATTYHEWALPQDEVAKHLASFVSEKLSFKNILDAGCGTGFLTKYIFLQNKSLNITGLDISHEMLKVYSHINPQIVLGDLENLQFEDASFTHCLSSFSLHWTNIEKSLPEIIRVTNKSISIALPIEGSLNNFNFPFPKKKLVLDLLEDNGVHIEKIKLEKLKIPFTGLDLIKYFHYTGTSYNPTREGLMNINTLKSLVEQLNKKEPFYNILYLSCNK